MDLTQSQTLSDLADACERPCTARPPIKWAGGKTQLLPELLKRVPKTFGQYWEPFAGGAALLFELHNLGWPTMPRAPIVEHWATINDSNAWLVATYLAIRDNIRGVVSFLKEYEAEYRKRGAEFYYEVRRRPHSSLLAAQGATFIFLNKTGYNGLFRVNRGGDFNVPHGKRAGEVTICDAENLYAVSRALQRVRIQRVDFSNCCGREAVPGDFVYFDPPYVPVSASSNFTAYTKEPFGPTDQTRLRDLARDLKRRGVHVLLSNADVPLVHELYDSDFAIERVSARRNINSKGGKRGAVGELLIH